MAGSTLLSAPGIMALLMWARQQLLWWPLHPIGYPIGAVWLMDQLWFSIALAWLLKVVGDEIRRPQSFSPGASFSSWA